MNKIEKMPPDTWFEQMKTWRDSAENTLRLLKKENYRKKKEYEKLKKPETQTEQSNRENNCQNKGFTTITGSISNGKTQFFYREKSNGKVIKKYFHQDEMENVKTQLQQEYFQGLIQNLEENLVLIDAFLGKYSKNRAWTYFESLPGPKREVVSPVLLPDEVFVEKWMAEEYQQMGFAADAAEHFTTRGERVRSKSEVIIADALGQLGVPYKYEVPLLLGDREIRPDFCCLNVRTRHEYFWEHLGMLDDADYVTRNCRKLEAYLNNGYFLGRELIVTWETAEIPFNREKAAQVIQKYLV